MNLLPPIAMPVWVWTWVFFTLPLTLCLLAISRRRGRVAQQQSEQRLHETVMEKLALERLTGPREPATATLTISRGKGWMGRLAAFRVMADGENIGKIGYGESYSFSLSAGPHVVHLEGGSWARSPSVDVDLEPGRTTSLRCQPHFAAWQAYWALLHPGEWIELTSDE